MSVAWSSTAPSPARRRTPERVWIALRVDTPRTAMPSCCRNLSLEIVNFIGFL
jgi:hypothetical protein